MSMHNGGRSKWWADLENRIGTVVAQWAHQRFGWHPLAFFFREADAPEEMEEC